MGLWALAPLSLAVWPATSRHHSPTYGHCHMLPYIVPRERKIASNGRDCSAAPTASVAGPYLILDGAPGRVDLLGAGDVAAGVWVDRADRQPVDALERVEWQAADHGVVGAGRRCRPPGFEVGIDVDSAQVVDAQPLDQRELGTVEGPDLGLRVVGAGPARDLRLEVGDQVGWVGEPPADPTGRGRGGGG